MWTVLTIIAVILLIIFLSRRQSAPLGGAIIGLIVGIIIALFGDGFEWSIVGKSIVVGILAGVGAELLGFIRDYFKT